MYSEYFHPEKGSPVLPMFFKMIVINIHQDNSLSEIKVSNSALVLKIYKYVEGTTIFQELKPTSESY